MRESAPSVLVTGGNGYIGSHSVVELIQAGYRPVIVDNLSNSTRPYLAKIEKLTGKTISFYKTNYQDEGAIAKIIKKEKINAVIHFAAYKFVGESVEQPLKYYENNVSGFIELLDVLNRHGVKRFVFSSSAAVYGNPGSFLVNEKAECLPTSPYGWSKYMDEIILRDFCHANPGFKGVALRYFNVIGAHPSGLIGESPAQTPQNLLPVILWSLTGKLPRLTIFGNDYPTPDGTCQRDYIHVVDLARAHVSALQKLIKSTFAPSFDVYNVGTGSPSSVLDLIKTFESVNKIKVPYKIGKRRQGDPAAYYADAQKIQKQLGWHAKFGIKEAVRDAWQWQKSLG